MGKVYEASKKRRNIVGEKMKQDLFEALRSI